MAREFAPRIHFLHLRSTRREADPESFHEAPHLDGDVDMVAVVRAVVDEERRRASAGREDPRIPMRPDHGHQMLDDIGKKVNPGYSAIGRLRGLAELRGVFRTVEALT
jgi:mannonate dehydratase